MQNRAGGNISGYARISQREIGSSLDDHVSRSFAASRYLDARADLSVHRVSTDERTVSDLAAAVTALWNPS